MKRPHPAALTITAIACASAFTAAQALEASVNVSHNAEYTTNSARTASDEIREWVHRPSVDAALRQEGAGLDLNAGYRFERRIYQDERFQDSNALTGQSSLLWRALPERLDFTIRNVRTESSERSLDPITEDNRQTISSTDVGPTLRFQPRRNHELQIEYLYTDVTANRTETDSQRHSGSLRYVMNVSSTRTVTLTGSNIQVEFDDALAADLDTTIASATLAQRGAHADYVFTAGYNRTEREDRDDVDGPIFDLGVTWRATPLTIVTLQAAHRITDRSGELLDRIGGLDDAIDEDTDLNEVFTQSRATVTVSRPLGNNQVSLVMLADREDYEDVLRDNERRSGTLNISRALNPLTTATASLGIGRREFTDEGRQQNEYRASLGLSRQLSPRFDLRIGASYDEWDADDPERSFKDWVGSVSLSYLLFDRR